MSSLTEKPIDPITHQQPKRKKKKKKKAKQVTLDGEDFDDDRGLNLAIGRMNSQKLADYLASCSRRLLSQASVVELEDLRVQETFICNTSSWDQTRDLEHMAAFLENLAPGIDLTKASEENGSPHTLVVAGAGLRAAELSRALRKFQTKDSVVAKLFAKHIKLQESIDLCKRKRICIGIGTPQRLLDLLDDGALSVISLQRIIVDASHIDQKRRGIIEMKDTHGPLIKLLNHPSLKNADGQLTKPDLVFY